MNIAEKSLTDLGINDMQNYRVVVKYSKKFNSFNASARLYDNTLIFNLSKKWQNISQDIQMGLIQELALKILKKEYTRTLNMELYHIFMKKIHIAIPKTSSDPELQALFHSVNAQYFHGLIEKPNLRWGSFSTTKLGSYDYGSDTVTISRILQHEPYLLEYVLYHELLHKKHKFANINSRTIHHSPLFKREEKKFQNHEKAESQLRTLCLRYKRHSKFYFC